MPRTLKQVGVEGGDKLRKLAEQSLEDPWCRTNPMPPTRPEQVLETLRQVEGRLTCEHLKCEIREDTAVKPPPFLVSVAHRGR